MALKLCKSGSHKWDEKWHAETLQKCCNGFVPIKVPMRNAGYLKWEPDEENLDPWLNKDGTRKAGATFITIMVPDHEIERIKRLRACEPQALMTMKRGDPN